MFRFKVLRNVITIVIRKLMFIASSATKIYAKLVIIEQKSNICYLEKIKD